jgi:CheY-like chemotaxis protein
MTNKRKSSFALKSDIYPPSILLVGRSSKTAPSLRRSLKKGGCQVQQADSLSDGALLARRNYFDLLVYNVATDEAVEEFSSLLGANPELASIPIVVMTRNQEPSALDNISSSSPVYYLPTDGSSSERLLNLVESVHYLSSRYA